MARAAVLGEGERAFDRQQLPGSGTRSIARRSAMIARSTERMRVGAGAGAASTARSTCGIAGRVTGRLAIRSGSR